MPCCFSKKDNLEIFSLNSCVNKYSFLLNPLWIYNLHVTFCLETLLMILRQLCHGLRPSIPRGPCTPKQSTASLSNHGSSYCCWQLTPVPSAEGIRWEWARRSAGANQRRPYRVLYPNRELFKVADSKKIRRKNHEGRYTKEEEDCHSTSSDKQKHIQSSHQISFPCLRLLPVCPSLSTVRPQTRSLNVE